MMSHSLVFEASTAQVSLALFQGMNLVEERLFTARRGANSLIFRPLGELLALISEGELERIVVGTGPGSYTGLRVTMAIAHALALSRGARLQGLSSFLGFEAPEREYWVVGDARRGQWFRARVRDQALEEEPILEGREGWEGAVGQLLARGKQVLSSDEKSPWEGVILRVPQARSLGGIALRTPREELPEVLALEPAYLAAPYITQPRKMGKTLALVE